VPNWFASNATTSVVIHTIVVATAVGAAFLFVFDENKIAAHVATANQYKAKTEVLEVEIARLRDENKKYLDWMVHTPNTIPHLENRIKVLTDEVSRHRDKPVPPKVEPLTKMLAPYGASRVLNVGESFVDPLTNAALGIGRITADFTAPVTLSLPGQKSTELPRATAGSVWTFTKGEKRYQLTLSKLDWYSNKAEVQLVEIDK
jgi:hypothetical protein